MAADTFELNKQIQGIQARLSQAENNITSQYVGTSLLVQGLLASPAATAGQAVEHIYNMVPSGFDVMQKLVSMVPIIDIKKMMMETATGLIDSMGDELDAIAGSIEAAANAAIETATDLVDSATSAAGGAASALADAVQSGEEAAISAATEASHAANALVTSANDSLTSLINFKSKAGAMIQAQAHAAKMTSLNLHITS